MRLLRAHKGLLARLAGSAMLLQLVAAAFCPNMANHRAESRVFDTVLGWVTLCTDGGATDGGLGAGASDGASGPDNHGHGSLCAALCAALVSSLATFAVFAFAALLPIAVPAKFFSFISVSPRRHVLFGGIGSRAPPALV